MAARQQLGVLATLPEALDRVLDGVGNDVVELSGNHDAPPSVGAVGPEPALPEPCSSTCTPCSVARGPPPLPRASRIASHTRTGVSGMSIQVMPIGLSASMTAFVTAGGQAIVPASPMPLTPSEFVGDGVSVRPVSNEGSSAAVGRA